jgi:hypothetical protein
MNNKGMSSGQARSIKITGDKLRKYFEKQCTDMDGVLYQELLSGLNNQNIKGTYLLKSGKNWQFHLGNFTPYINNWGTEFLFSGKKVKYNQLNSIIIEDITNEKFINSFMLKANFFVIYDTSNWLIFKSNDILKLMQNTEFIKWRILESGRIKGDIFMDGIKRTIFTMEYRAEEHKKQFVFGAHGGGAGEKFKNILKKTLLFNCVPVDYSLWQE